MKADNAIEAALVVIVILAVILGGSWLWWRNYNECRAHGFSVYYCWSRK